jgi:hypothetical protein
MTPQMKELFTGSNRTIFLMWLILGVAIGSKILLGSVLVLALFILVFRTNSHLAFIAAIVLPVVFNFL